jgi:hypothetical protein
VDADLDRVLAPGPQADPGAPGGGDFRQGLIKFLPSKPAAETETGGIGDGGEVDGELLLRMEKGTEAIDVVDSFRPLFPSPF